MRFSNMVTAVDTHVCGEPGRVITGICQYVLDADDPFPEGFTVSAIWP